MIDDIAKNHDDIQSNQEKLLRWQEVTSCELDKYYGLGASEDILKSLFSDRWFCQSVNKACVSVSVFGTTRLVTGDMSKVYSTIPKCH